MDRRISMPYNIRFHNAIRKIPQKTPPLWMMRQAGRYHKKYRALREKYSFEQLCKIPEVAAEVALGPIQDFDFDLAILFSDILFPIEALGIPLAYTDNGPKFEWSLNEETIHQLLPVNVATEHIQFQKQAMLCTREMLPKDKSLIGFVGGVWTLFCYAVDGKHNGNLILPKKSIELRKNFFAMMTELLIQNIQLQFEGGAEVVMVLDTAAGDLSPQEFQEVIIPTIQKISSTFPGKIGYYAKGSSESAIVDIMNLENLGGVGFDHRLPLKEILLKKRNCFVQGNFDQTLLFRDPSDFLKTLKAFLKPIRGLSPEERAGWVCGLGHGILPQTPEENVRLFVDTVREVFL
jgi:uroporphyrinogen decarboxylase